MKFSFSLSTYCSQTFLNDRRNLPASNAQVHYNITNAEVNDRPAIDEVSYVDFDPASMFPFNRPNFCNNCGKDTRNKHAYLNKIYEDRKKEMGKETKRM